MTYLKKKKDSINFDVISSSFNNVVSSMLDHVEIFHDSRITVVILTFEQRNGTLQAIYVLDYLLFVILKQVKSWCFSSCCLRTWRNDSIDHFCFVFLGEELTFEYGVESEFRGDTIFHCLCGAESCTGFMGRSKKLGPVGFFFSNDFKR